MTILAGVRSANAAVIAADSQETVAGLRRYTTKVMIPQADLVAAWAGYKDVAQAMELSLREEPLDLAMARSRVAEAAKDRFRRIRSDPDIEHRSEFNEFMLGWYCRNERKAVALHLLGQGSAVWAERWEYAGSPKAIATARTIEAAISYVTVDDLGAEQLSLIVLKVLRDTISVAGAEAGIGGGVQLATIAVEGVRVLGPAELRAANDALDVWQERCAELLPGLTVPTTDAGRVDHGLRPPS